MVKINCYVIGCEIEYEIWAHEGSINKDGFLIYVLKILGTANFCTEHIPSVCVAHLCGWDTFVQQRCVTCSFLTFSLVWKSSHILCFAWMKYYKTTQTASNRVTLGDVFGSELFFQTSQKQNLYLLIPFFPRS